MFRKGIILLILAILLLTVFVSCIGGSSSENNKTQSTAGNSTGNQSTKVSSDKETAAPAPVIEKIDAFLKKDTTLKESDVIVIYIRNVTYDEQAKTFKKDFKVYLDDKEQAFHDVKLVSTDYYAITVDISEVTAGSVYVTYEDTKSNSIAFTLE